MTFEQAADYLCDLSDLTKSHDSEQQPIELQLQRRNRAALQQI
jgi:hypothetical protein